MKGQIRFYQIYNTQTGLYSKGGTVPTWSKKGKVWANLGHIKAHITNWQRYQKTYNKDRGLPSEWVIEEYIFDQSNKRVITMAEFAISTGNF